MDLPKAPMYALRCARVIDGLSQEPLQNQVILIEANKIVALGSEDSVNIPSSAQVLAFDNTFTVLPGLIDCHVHPCIRSLNYQQDHLQWSTGYKALVGLKACQDLLNAGWTTLRVAGDTDVFYAPFDIRRAIEEGLHQGPRIFGAGHYLSSTGGGGDIRLAPEQHCCISDGKVVDGPEEMRKAVREEVKYGSNWIKLLATGTYMGDINNPNLITFSPEELSMAIEEATRHGVPVMAHAHSTEGIKACARAGVRSIEHGSFIDDEGIALLKQKGIYLVPTLAIGEYFLQISDPSFKALKDLESKYDAVKREGVSKAIAAGVKIVIGTDFIGWKPISISIQEFIMLTKLGMKPMDAIKAGTSLAAELLQWEDKIGSIKAGHLADIIAVKGNPVVDISSLEHVHFVMKDGKIIRNSCQ